MSAGEYRRPSIVPVEFRDHAGALIPYGNRWDWDGPPGETYSVVTHPERFEPLVEVADALVAHLVGRFEVTVTQLDAAQLAAVFGRADMVRAVRVVPAAHGAAPLTVGVFAHPGVELRAGALWGSVYPPCSCDACDETWEYVAECLEGDVFGVVEGGLSERVTWLPRPRIHRSMVTSEGRSEGWGLAQQPIRSLLAPWWTLRRAGGRWHAWQERR